MTIATDWCGRDSLATGSKCGQFLGIAGDWLEATVDLTAAATAGTYAITLSPTGQGRTAGPDHVSLHALRQNFAGRSRCELANAINAGQPPVQGRGHREPCWRDAACGLVEVGGCHRMWLISM